MTTGATERQRTYDLEELLRRIEDYLRRENYVQEPAELTLFVRRNAKGEFTDLVAQGRKERLV